MKKSDAETLERIIRSLPRHRYWYFIGWLSNDADGPLWDCLGPRRRKPKSLNRQTYEDIHGDSDAAMENRRYPRVARLMIEDELGPQSVADDIRSQGGMSAPMRFDYRIWIVIGLIIAALVWVI